ncbi:MAG: hypothetical protein GY754_05930 [bacterium]|nr:hypothetical protein [bacterium]
MNKTIQIMKIFNIPVFAHWSVLLIVPCAFLYARNIQLVPFVSLFCVLLMLIHELGHAYMCRRVGAPVISIYLSFLSGRCFHMEPYGIKNNFKIMYGGLLFQVLCLFLAIPVLLILKNFPGELSKSIAVSIAGVFIGYNLIIIMLNLLPIEGLDGKFIWSYVAAEIRAKKKNTKVEDPAFKDLFHELNKKPNKKSNKKNKKKEDSQVVFDFLFEKASRNGFNSLNETEKEQLQSSRSVLNKETPISKINK